MARVAPFKQIFSALEKHITDNKALPVLQFDNDDSLPKELQGRHFLFNTSVGANPKKQKVGVIMVVEQRGTMQVPFMSLHSVIDKKDMRMTVQFFGADKLSDAQVDTMLNAIKAYIGK